MDRPHTEQIIDLIARSVTLVVPYVVLDASMMGITGAAFGEDQPADVFGRANLRQERESHHPFGAPDRRSSFSPQRVAIETARRPHLVVMPK